MAIADGQLRSPGPRLVRSRGSADSSTRIARETQMHPWMHMCPAATPAESEGDEFSDRRFGWTRLEPHDEPDLQSVCETLKGRDTCAVLTRLDA